MTTEGTRIPEIVWRRLGDLQLNPENYRLGEVPAIIASIREFGYNKILGIRNNILIAGNHALLALRQMEAKRPKRPPIGIQLDDDGAWTVRCIDLSHLSETDALAYMVADNRTQELGTQDAEALKKLLETILATSPTAFEATGYTSDDLEDLLASLPETETDDGPEAKTDIAEELQKKWQTALGQLWRIPSKTAGGDHYILCGSSTDADDVSRVLQGRRPLIMVTDPPYGVDYEPGWRHDVLNSSATTNVVKNDNVCDWREAYELSNAQVAYVWHGGLTADVFMESIKKAGYEIRSQIIWVKPGLIISRGHYHWQHEPAIYCVKVGEDANWQGDRKQSTVWEANNRATATKGSDDLYDSGHSTQKPVLLYERAYRNHCRHGQLVYEPFSGSGTAFIAAERLGLICAGIELEPKFVATALERMKELGLSPELVVEKETADAD